MMQLLQMAQCISWCIPLDKKKIRLTVSEIVLFGVLGALMFALKLAMAALPNIEPISLLVLLLAAVFGWKALYPIYLYVMLEILVYGIGTWNICYMYVWLILAVMAILLRRMESPFGWALLSAVFGLAFGALCGIVDVFVGGFSFAAAKWVSGIPFDLLHCGGNFVIALLLFAPLRKLLAELRQKMQK